jgi:hypothetical protein
VSRVLTSVVSVELDAAELGGYLEIALATC